MRKVYLCRKKVGLLREKVPGKMCCIVMCCNGWEEVGVTAVFCVFMLGVTAVMCNICVCVCVVCHHHRHHLCV
jgi:hypothetical protein